MNRRDTPDDRGCAGVKEAAYFESRLFTFRICELQKDVTASIKSISPACVTGAVGMADHSFKSLWKMLNI